MGVCVAAEVWGVLGDKSVFQAAQRMLYSLFLAFKMFPSPLRALSPPGFLCAPYFPSAS